MAWDVIVVGAGHAGIEAADAAARMGARVALICGNLDTIGKMSCNPAIGGVAKGQVVREIDALGGVMGKATDANGIHWRMLGLSKGPAMWSPRAQCDKQAYATWMKHWVESRANLMPVQGDCVDLITESDGDGLHVRGVILRDGRELRAPSTVITTGTFLQGLLHQGEAKTPGGRMGDGPGLGISGALSRCGLRLIRLKTGTPPRVHADSIDWSHCAEQPGDETPRAFAFDGGPVRNHIHCWITHTRPEAHEIIRANLDRAPMYNGQIDSVGPRYCPSIEDKVTRFADRERHQLFLEPEGITTKEVYVNGLSTSLPIDLQDQVLAAIPALASAHVMRYGYAVEYDVVDPAQLDHRLGVPSVPGLFLGGQINGTSGYEEAAIQGLVAGANAALAADGADPFLLDRSSSYGGVLIDDLVGAALDEPYRLFTARAEHRLHLRSDNADRRLVPAAARVGLVDAERAARVRTKSEAIENAVSAIGEETRKQVAGEAWDLSRAIGTLPGFAELPATVAEGAWIELRYQDYVERARKRIERLERLDGFPLPDDFEPESVPGLSNEGRQRLLRHRPGTLGAARTLAGLTAADVENLWAWLERSRSQKVSSP